MSEDGEALCVFLGDVRSPCVWMKKARSGASALTSFSHQWSWKIYIFFYATIYWGLHFTAKIHNAQSCHLSVADLDTSQLQVGLFVSEEWASLPDMFSPEGSACSSGNGDANTRLSTEQLLSNSYTLKKSEGEDFSLILIALKWAKSHWLMEIVPLLCSRPWPFLLHRDRERTYFIISSWAETPRLLSSAREV